MTSERAVPFREFDVTTNFQIEAVKPGGLSRKAALQRAERNLDQIRRDFSRSLDDEIVKLLAIAALARRANPTWRDDLRRHCTDLSDAASIVGYALVAFVATHLQQVCEATEDEAQCADIITRGADVIRHFGSEKSEAIDKADLPGLAVRLTETNFATPTVE